MKEMEENINQATPSVVGATQPPLTSKPPFRNWWKVGVLVVGTVLAGSIIYAAYQYSQKQQAPGRVYPASAPTPLPTPTPSLATQITPTPTPDPTANWKTHQSPKHGFLIKYPDEINLEEQADDSVLLTLWGPTQKQETEFYDGISLWFNSGSLGTKNLKEFVDEKVAQAKENAEILKPPSVIVIGGVTGYTFTAQGLGIFKDIYLPRGSGAYIEITDATRDPTGKGFQKTVDQILATLKFLD